MREHTTFSGVGGFVNCGMGGGGLRRGCKCGIKDGLLDVRMWAVDRGESRVGGE